ncbi:unnamed protein product [Owenia fusiformis]|nr:unnamed protein product [Owenia fusiformis]
MSENQLFPDNFAKREIMSLTVRCSNSNTGCAEVIILKKLQNHLESCPFSCKPCPNQCSAILLRRDMPRHLAEECIRRLIRCNACKDKIIFEEYKAHKDVCPMVQVRCTHCDVSLTREQMQRHLELDCPRAIINCTFSVVGCEIKMERSSLALHMQEYTQPHLRMLVTSFGDVLKVLHSQDNSKIAPLELPSVDPSSEHPHQFKRMNSQTSVKIREIEEMYDSSNFHKGNSVQNRHSTGAISMGGGGGGEVSMVEFATLKERNTYQDEKLQTQSQQIIELLAKNSSLEKVVLDQKKRLKELEYRVHDNDARSCNGVYVWKVNNYSHLRHEAQSGETTVIHSPGFYTSYYGYKLCVRMNLNGVDNAHGTHLSIFIHFMQGEYDFMLDWPFNGKITLSIMDQSEVCELRQNVTETLSSKSNLAAFQKPETIRNHKGFGYMEFAPLSLLENGRYIKNDTLVVKAEVHPEPHR